ncbi:IclR family transcriptional regulator [Modestobacter muralis]|uniref:IclR family transcriptional regulator n=2 Tax=Modestobacter muralis TaxID=1608614 RepID=A0A6P0EU51_9ACTN|nr:IclR family transcriptional regulator [Modestobacter muralis]NEK95231.1 IclR family transcriptional regulator [Modestobacter muralis]NEN52119.1 IclR family transcriptional regulator [Modestobacter muralis]
MLPRAPSYGSTPQYPIESVDNALQVLLLLGESPSLRLTDVSRYLGVASSTAHRLLAMLQYRGFVRQDAATRGYVPGPTLDGLAFGVLRRLDVRNRARPVLERLNADLEETVHLGRLEGNEVHFIDSLESGRALRVVGRLGRSMPAHCTSTGKALLSELPEDQVLRLFPEEELPRLTANSIGTRTALLRELAQIRRRGYARSLEEAEEGVSSVAVPLHSTQSPRLAINVSVPASRMTDMMQDAVIGRLQKSAEELDHLLL